MLFFNLAISQCPEQTYIILNDRNNPEDELTYDKSNRSTLNIHFIASFNISPSIGTKISDEFSDKISKKQEEALNNVFKNVINHFHYLKVTKTNKYSLKKLQNKYPKSNIPDQIYDNVDLLIYFRPNFEDSNDHVIFHDIIINTHGNDFHRPLASVLTCDSELIPNSSDDPKNKELYQYIIHEMYHLLGLAADVYQYWIDDTTGEPYENPIYTTNNVDFYLTTPRVKKWVQNHFQIDTLPGLLLEADANNIIGSHPSSRLFVTDILTCSKYQQFTFSPLPLLVLLDTGWYSFDYEETKKKIATDLVFLNTQLISDPDYDAQQLFKESSYLSYPQSYFCQNPGVKQCYYNYRWKGTCNLKKSNLSDNDPNPYMLPYIGIDPMVNYAPLLLPAESCQEPFENVPDQDDSEDEEESEDDQVYSKDSICALSTLQKRSSLKYKKQPSGTCFEAKCVGGRVQLFIGNTKLNCNFDGQRLKAPGYSGYVECPPAKIACLSLNENFSLSNTKRSPAIEYILPDRGNPGSVIVIHGSGFNPDSIVGIWFDSDSANPLVKAPGFTQTETDLYYTISVKTNTTIKTPGIQIETTEENLKFPSGLFAFL